MLKKISGLLAVLVALSFESARAEWVGFDPNFQWCASTASYQIEGGNKDADFWEWEKGPGHIKNAERSGLAADHWNRVSDDIDLMKKIGVKAYRLSIEWARIEPAPGKWDHAAIKHYRDEIEKLIRNKIEPIVTLQHFTLPTWIARRGAWEWPGFPDAFRKYTRVVYEQIAPEAKTWVTINEPMVFILGGYFKGKFPPGQKRSLNDLVPVIVGVLKSHAEAYHTLHRLAARHGRSIRVGIAHHLRTIDPATNWLSDVLLAKLADQAWNWMLPEAATTGHLRFHFLWMVNQELFFPQLVGTQDYIGVNYYSGDLIAFSKTEGFRVSTHPGMTKTEMGWDIYPEGFYRVLLTVKQKFPRLPIIVTENGISDGASHETPDQKRIQFMADHLWQMHRAQTAGARIEGYCYWSLIDNFEWLEGFTPRFGLYEVDYSDFQRYPRKSADFFGNLTRQGGFEY